MFRHISCRFCCTQRENLGNTCRNLILRKQKLLRRISTITLYSFYFRSENGFSPLTSPFTWLFQIKYESLFHKSRKEIELPFSMKYSKLAVRISPIISKNKIQAKGFRMIQAAWKSIEAIRRYLQKC